MANLTGTASYVNVLRQLESTDPAHPNTWNPNYQALINNDVFLKALVERLIKEHSHDGTLNGGSKIPLANINVPVGDAGILTGKDLAFHINERNPHGTRASDVGAATAQEVTSHLADGAAHGIGNKATLQTTHKTTLVGAINEAFTSASNGKGAVKAAITGVDPDVVIPPDPTFPDLATAIGQISTGKKWASGIVTSSANKLLFQEEYSKTNVNYNFVSIIEIGFDPSFVLMHSPSNSNNGAILDKRKSNREVILANDPSYGRGFTLSGNPNIILNASQIQMPVDRGSTLYEWIAFE